MSDRLVAASAAESGIAFAAAITTQLVTEIRDRHDLWPTAIAAVGRLATGAALFGVNLKGDERISLQIAGNGPLGTLAADAWLLDEGAIGVRGYAANPQVDLPIDERGKFDVGGAVGAGTLQVTRSREIGQPYIGVVALQSGEIAEDLAAYLAQSEQIPSVVALGVLANPSGVVAAGGILAQVLPGADPSALTDLEARALAMPPVTQLIAEGADADTLLRELTGDRALRGQRSLDVRFACLCNRQKVETVLMGMGANELDAMASERDSIEAICEFCKTAYEFTSPELRALGERLRTNANETPRAD